MIDSLVSMVQVRRIVAISQLAILQLLNIDSDARAEDVLSTMRIKTSIGVTRDYRPIEVMIAREDLDLSTNKGRILLIGASTTKATRAVERAIQWFDESPDAAAWRESYLVSAIPDSQLTEFTGFPPQGDYYGGCENPAAAYLWRWIGMHAPDLVVLVAAGSKDEWRFPGEAQPSESNPAFDLLHRLNVTASTARQSDDLANALTRIGACETGPIPTLAAYISRTESSSSPPWIIEPLLKAIQSAGGLPVSAARRELQSRIDRSPLEVARQLSRHYGHDLNQVAYIPALALVGRIGLGELTNDASHQTDVSRIVAPYVRGDKPINRKSGSELAGHLIFTELANRSEGSVRERFVELARLAADQAFDAQGGLKPSMPFHNEMSDAVFMGGPILASVGRLTGDHRYFDACLQNTRFMRKLVLRDDGLYRHSPLDEAAWGRGNGFPALGMALILSDYPADHPDRAELLAAYQSHMKTLARWQDPSGCWHQIIDKPASYRELSCTCMITFAMARGVRSGWVPRDEFRPIIDRAWQAIKCRVPENGRLVDVCTGTGKQKYLAAYYDRTAILGPDARGGAMALMVATEIAQLP